MQINIRFASNIDQLKRNLAEGLEQIEATRAGAAKLAQSLGGDNLVRAAHNFTAAIAQLGGTQNLTASNQARVNSVMTRAVEVLTAQGKGNTALARTFQTLADQTRQVEQSVGRLHGIFADLGQNIVATAAGFVSAEAIIGAFKAIVHGLSSELQALTIHGAEVADVEENFKRLTAQSGLLGDSLLGALRAGTHNTITDFDLMTRANQNLAAGLNLSQQQFSTLAKGAFALAQATGVDVKTALDTMNDAMLTGRARALALLTGKIDLSKAEAEFAKRIGTTTDKLSDAGKLEAARVAILAAVGAATDRLGEQTDGLDERVQQARVAWQNFEEDLGKTIATSAVLETGLEGVKQIIIDTFGDHQKTLVESVARAIDLAEIAVVRFAQSGVQAGAFVAKEWIALNKLIGNTAQILGLAEGAALFLQKGVLAGAVGNDPETDKARKENAAAIRALAIVVHDRGVALQEMDRQQKGIDESTATFTKRLEELQSRMEAARTTTNDFVGPLQAEAKAHEAAGVGAAKHGDLIKLSASEVSKAKQAAEKLAKALKDQADALIPLTGEQAKQALALHNLGLSNEEIGLLIKANAVQIQQYLDIYKLKTEIERDGAAKSVKIFQDWQKQLEAAADAAGKAILEVDLLQRKSQRAADDVIAKSNLGPFDLKRRDLILDAQDQLAHLDKLQRDGANVDRQRAEALHALEVALAAVDDEEREQARHILSEILPPTLDWAGALNEVANGLTQLAQVSGDAFGGLVKDIARVVVAFNTFLRVTSQIVSAMKSVQAATSKGLGSSAGDAAGTASAGLVKWSSVAATALATFTFVLEVAEIFESRARAAAAPFKALREQTGLTFEQIGRRAMEAGISMREFELAVNGSTTAVKHLKEAFQLQDDALTLFNDTVKKYKLTLSDLGPAAAQNKIMERAIQLLQDFKILTAGGVNQDVVLKKMSTALNQLVRDALRTGAALPESLRPMLEGLLRLGLLTDGAGHKLTSLAGIHFTSTLTSQFDTLIQKINLLAIAIAKAFHITIDFGQAVGRIRPPGTPSDGIAVPRPGAATGGLVTSSGIRPFSNILQFRPRLPDTVPVMLAPGELVLNGGQQERIASLLSSTGTDGGRWHTGVPTSIQPAVNVQIDARGSWFDDVGVDKLARRIQKSFWKNVSQNKDESYTRARAALGHTS